MSTFLAVHWTHSFCFHEVRILEINYQWHQVKVECAFIVQLPAFGFMHCDVAEKRLGKYSTSTALQQSKTANGKKQRWGNKKEADKEQGDDEDEGGKESRQQEQTKKNMKNYKLHYQCLHILAPSAYLHTQILGSFILKQWIRCSSFTCLTYDYTPHKHTSTKFSTKRKHIYHFPVFSILYSLPLSLLYA